MKSRRKVRNRMETYKGNWKLVIRKRQGGERKMRKNKHVIVWPEHAVSSGVTCDPHSGVHRFES
jgi:hypothetical protein